MKKMIAAVLITISAVTAGVPSSNAFLEADGIVIMEVESAPVVSGWVKQTSLAGYRGDGYYKCTLNSMSSGGQGILGYPVYISTSGTYQLMWRSRIAMGTSSTEHNDSWARLVDANGNAVTPEENDLEPKGSWYKIYMNTLSTWAWKSSNHDNNPRAVAWQLEAGKNYTFQISARSEGHAIDRICLFETGTYNYGNTETGSPSSSAAVMTVLPESPREGQTDIVMVKPDDAVSRNSETVCFDLTGRQVRTMRRTNGIVLVSDGKTVQTKVLLTPAR